MPTSSALALERLLEAGVKEFDTHGHSDSIAKSRTTHVYISPALYTIPDPAPIPDSSTASVSPSPYVVNRKRRNLPLPEAQNSVSGFEIQQKSVSDGATEAAHNSLVVPTGDDLSVQFEPKEAPDAGLIDTKEDRFMEEFAAERDGTNNYFFDSVSVAGYSDADDLRQAAGKHTPLSNQTEFYDADEEFFSDGSVSNASLLVGPSVEAELCAAKVTLFGEIERHKRAEDALSQMHNQWKHISRCLSQAGLSFCAPWSDGTDGLHENDLAEKFCQEIVVARFVSEAIGRGQVRAETEAAVAAVIESKNLEISQLRDKLQYYESVNHEMSQRNQEVVEVARRRRQKMRRKQRRIWSFIGLSVSLGASVLAYSYLPWMNRPQSFISNDFSDAPSSTRESA